MILFYIFKDQIYSLKEIMDDFITITRTTTTIVKTIFKRLTHLCIPLSVSIDLAARNVLEMTVTMKKKRRGNEIMSFPSTIQIKWHGCLDFIHL